jgi:hypothetical protein
MGWSATIMLGYTVGVSVTPVKGSHCDYGRKPALDACMPVPDPIAFNTSP